MSKRKATEGQQDEGGAKKPRAAGAAAAPAAAAAASSSADSLDAALRRADLVPRIAVHTLKLTDAIKPSSGSHAERIKALILLMKADADRPESLLDWSLVPVGAGLLLFLCSCLGDDVAEADKIDVRHLLKSGILPLLPQLRSFDPATVDAATGNNALHEMCSLFVMSGQSDWSFQLASQLIDHGVSVHGRNKKGRTPLLEYAATAVPQIDSAVAMRLQLQYGADLNAQDGDGDGLLHHLARGQALGVLEDLCASGGAGLDFAMLNSDDQTAADVAAVSLVEAGNDSDSEDSGTEESESRLRARIHRLLMAQTALWTKHSRPVLLRCLDGVLPVTDLAKLVLAYVDGSGASFAATANDSDDDDIDPPASASAAAAAASSS